MKSWRSSLAIGVSILIWGFNYAPVKYSLASVPPMVLAFFTSSLAALLLWIFCGRRIVRELRVHPYTIDFFWAGLFGTFGFNALQYFGLRYTTAINASLIIATMPIFGLLAGWWLHRETFSWMRLCGAALSMSGVIYLLTDGVLSRAALSFNIGNGLILLGVMSLVTHAVFVQRLRRTFRSYTVVALQVSTASLLFVPFAIAEHAWQYLPQLSAMTIGAIVYIAIIRSIVAGVCYAYGLRYIPVSTATGLSNCTALIAVVFATTLLHEQLTMVHCIAGGLIVAGVSVVALGYRTRPPGQADAIVNPAAAVNVSAS